MFTGLVSERGSVRTVEGDDHGVRLTIDAGLAAQLDAGDSVAVSGVCLTAVDSSHRSFAVEVMQETLTRSALGALAPGDSVNLELPLRAADRLGGHIVQGHVDGLATVESVRDEGFARRVQLRATPEVCRYVVEKGSVALDGVSLTAVRAEAESFAVALVPETLERTTLGDVEPGRSVNVEVDVIAKYVERLGAPHVERAEGQLTAGPAGGAT